MHCESLALASSENRAVHATCGDNGCHYAAPTSETISSSPRWAGSHPTSLPATAPALHTTSHQEVLALYPDLEVIATTIQKRCVEDKESLNMSWEYYRDGFPLLKKKDPADTICRNAAHVLIVARQTQQQAEHPEEVSLHVFDPDIFEREWVYKNCKVIDVKVRSPSASCAALTPPPRFCRMASKAY